MSRETNWAGNLVYSAGTIHRPTSLEELQGLVASSPALRPLGTRHSFNDLADGSALVSLESMPIEFVIDQEAMTVSCSAATKYGILAAALEREGFALHNMGSLPHICVAGATATATHGSGNTLGNLSSAVRGLEIVRADGEVVQVSAGDPDFAGSVVHLGALGVVTRVTLAIEPSFQVAQEVLECLPWGDLVDRFDEVFATAYSVSVFPKWGEDAGNLWLKWRLTDGEYPEERLDWGAVRAALDRHPLDELTGDNCTPQMMLVGSWNERLPHFRLDSIPASGEEIQTEYMFERGHAAGVIDRLRAFEPELRDLILVSEIRTVAADDLWMSTAYGRDTVCIHFSFKRDQAAVEALLPKLEEQLAEFEPRPHWGKVFAMGAPELRASYPRFDDFRALVERYDPDGKFRNPYLDRTIFG